MSLRRDMASCVSHERGLSFIEIVVTLSLVGILWMLASPSLSRLLASYALANATEQVAGDLRLARARAMTQNAREQLQLASQSYVLRRESPRLSNIYVDDGPSMPIPRGVSMTATPGTPTFDARGLAVQPFTLIVTGQHGATKRLTINAIGHVAID